MSEPQGETGQERPGRPSSSGETGETGEPPSGEARSEQGRQGTEATAAGKEHAERAEHLVGTTESDRFQERWREIQSEFVDDPQAAVRDADALADELLHAFTAAATSRKQDIGEGWRTGEGGGVDTERLRLALHGYRDFVTRIMAV